MRGLSAAAVNWAGTNGVKLQVGEIAKRRRFERKAEDASTFELGELVVANHTEWEMVTQVAFEPMDRWARSVDPRGGWLTPAPRGEAVLERLRGQAEVFENLEVLGSAGSG